MKSMVAVTSIVFTLAAPVARAADPPKVDIRVSVADGTVLDDLDAAHREAVRLQVQKSLIDSCDDLKFLTWTTGDTANTTHLDAAVKLNDGGDLVLQFAATLNGSAYAVQNENSFVLYDRYSNVPTDDSKLLNGEIAAKVKSGFKNQVFRDTLHAYFLGTIPLTDRLSMPRDGQEAFIPLSRSQMQVKDPSLFRVVFDDAAAHGALLLEAEPAQTQASATPVSDQIRCRKGGEFQLNGQTVDWTSSISKSFGDPQSAKNVEVTMKRYVFDPNPRTNNKVQTHH